MLLVLIMLGILMEKKHALSLKLPSFFIINNILLTVYNYVIITKIVFKSIVLSNNFLKRGLITFFDNIIAVTFQVIFTLRSIINSPMRSIFRIFDAPNTNLILHHPGLCTFKLFVSFAAIYTFDF